MVAYAVGDIQGCNDVLVRLLRRLDFKPAHDVLYGCGDMVNRGPQSLETLTLLHDLGTSFLGVLGNHELFLLAVAFGILQPGKKDTVDAILASPQRNRYIDWLLRMPFLRIHEQQAWSVVHAGLLPTWSLSEAMHWADKGQQALSQNNSATRLLRTLFAGRDMQRDAAMLPLARAVQTLTMMRICRADGTLKLNFSGVPERAPPGYAPWFAWPHPRPATHQIVCGHWAALGLHRGPGVVALDTGCVWGGALTAVALPPGDCISEPLHALP